MRGPNVYADWKGANLRGFSNILEFSSIFHREADDLKGVPVKIESQTAHGRLTAVYRDIVLGTPDAARFAIPDKRTPIEKMGQVAEHKIVK